MKKCKTCEVDLVIGENITQGRYNNYKFCCEGCHHKEYGRGEYKNDRKCKGCEDELHVGKNFTQAMHNNSNYYCKNCHQENVYGCGRKRSDEGKRRTNELEKKKRRERNLASVAGVYGIYYNDNLLYVGESQFCQSRFYSHLNQISANSTNAIGLDIKKYRNDYYQVILLEEEDKRLRLIAEIELITKHKPPANAPYRVKGYIHSPVDGG